MDEGVLSTVSGIIQLYRRETSLFNHQIRIHTKYKKWSAIQIREDIKGHDVDVRIQDAPMPKT